MKAEVAVVYTAKKGRNEQINKWNKNEWRNKERYNRRAAFGESKGPHFPRMEIMNIFENRMKLG